MSDTPLSDEGCVRALVARYCHAIAARDDAAWAATWAEDAEWQILGRSVRGRDAILAHYQTLLAAFRWVMQSATDGIVEVSGDGASGRWLVTERLQDRAGTPLLSVGVYRDDYRRCADGVWRFARRRFAATYLGPADGSGQPIALPEGF